MCVVNFFNTYNCLLVSTLVLEIFFVSLNHLGLGLGINTD